MKDKLLKKFFSFSYGSWLGIIIGLISTPIMTRILTPEDFGKASMFTLAINIVMVVIVFGTDQSFVRFFYEEEENKRGGLLYNCLKIPSILLFITIFIIVIFYKRISILLFDEVNVQIIIALIIGIVMQVYNRYTSLVIRMQQKGNKFSILEILNKLLNFLLMIGFYFLFGKKYIIIAYSYVFTMMFLTIISLFWEKKFWNLKNSKLINLKHTKKEIFNYAFPTLVTVLIYWLFQAFDRIAIKHWSTLREVGMYSAAYKIAGILGVIQSSFSTFWTPVAFEHYEKNPNDNKFFENISKLIQFLMLTIAILSIMFKNIVILILGKEYSEAFYIMPFLVFMPVMFTISETTVLGINFSKKPKWHMVISVVACVFNIIGNWLLVPKYGAVGSGVATALAYILFFVLRTHISLKFIKLNFGLKRFYLILSIVMLYCFVPFIVKNDILIFIIGFVILLFIFAFYFKEIKNVKKIKK